MSMKRIFEVVVATAAVVVVALGLVLDGPVDFGLGLAAGPAGFVVHLIATATLAIAALGYFIASIRPTFQGIDWIPCISAASGLLFSVWGLRALEFNVHLHGQWVICLMVTAFTASVGTAVLGLSAVTGLLLRWRRSQRYGTHTG